MKPDKVNSVLLVGQETTSNPCLLFQCAIYWAEQGFKVLYISPDIFNKLPPLFHGTSSTISDTFSQIRFMALPRWQDLLQHLYSLHRFAHIPQVILVEGLDHYCYPAITEIDQQHEKHDAEMHSAFVCASLLDTMSICTNQGTRTGHLIASIKCLNVHKLSLIINNFFSDLVWLTEMVNDNVESSQSFQITNIESRPGQTRRIGMEFTSKSDCFIMLKKIFSITIR